MRAIPVFVLVVSLLLTGCRTDDRSILGRLGRGDEIIMTSSLYARAQQTGDPSNAAAAKDLLERMATDKDSDYAAFYAGVINQELGYGESAGRYYAKAAPHIPAAKHNLALMILNGELQDGKTEDALKLLDEAAQDYTQSMLLLADMYSNGFSNGAVRVEKNEALAREWAEKAVMKSKDPRAELMLGRAYLESSGRGQNIPRAIRMLTAAARAGLPEAQFMMAFTTQDPVVSAKWLTVATMNDAAYMERAQEIVASMALSDEEKLEIRSDAELWVAAHRNAPQLVQYWQPIKSLE